MQERPSWPATAQEPAVGDLEVAVPVDHLPFPDSVGSLDTRRRDSAAERHTAGFAERSLVPGAEEDILAAGEIVEDSRDFGHTEEVLLRRLAALHPDRDLRVGSEGCLGPHLEEAAVAHRCLGMVSVEAAHMLAAAHKAVGSQQVVHVVVAVADTHTAATVVVVDHHTDHVPGTRCRMGRRSVERGLGSSVSL